MTHETSLTKLHLGTACKYAGISFIAGAVNHGFFSGTRSLITAGIGMIAFIIGNLIERKNDSTGNFVAEVLVGSVFSIGLGFFTGGLQHFPDSPQRSAWVVPLGFALSMISLMALRKSKPAKADLIYAVVANLFVVAACVLALNYLNTHGSSESGHSHGDDHHHSEEVDAKAAPEEPAHDHHSDESH